MFVFDMLHLLISFDMGRLKQSLDAFLKAEMLYGRPDAQVCYYIGKMYFKNEIV